MSEEKITRIAREIYENVGGPENVKKVIHCMTRVRMTIIDETKVDLSGLKAIKGVLGVIEDETLQVVIGPGTVNKVAQAMVDMVGVKLGEPFPDTSDSLDELMAKTKANAKEKYNKPSKFKAVLNTIAKIFVPLIPAFVGAGLIGGLASVLSNLVTAGTLDLATWGQIITVLKIIQGGIFSYLAIYVGLNSAQEFGATPALGGVIGAVSLLLGMDPNAPLKNVFNGTPLSAGQGGIIGVIFAVWLLAIFEKRLHKFVPESLDIIITPTLSLLVIGLAEIFLIMPVAGVISSSLVGAINFILSVGGGISGFVLGALFLPMVMFGLHQILTPIHLEMISKTGSTQLLPVLAMAGAGQVGAAIALWVRLRKDKEFVERVKGALPVGILGIGEPLIYGITLPLGRPFVTACIGGGIGGAVIGALGNAGAIAIGPSGVALLPLIADGKWWIYLCGLLGGYIGGFIATYFFGIPADAKMKADNYAAVGPKEVVESTLKVVEPVKFKTTTIKAPLSGKVVKLSQLNDQVFASGLMGKGIAIEPTNGEVCAPVTGTITSILPTKHAIGITSDEGIELLIHVGMDTVELEGVGFECFVNENEHVKAGDLLLKADLKKIKAAGFSVTTPIVVTNTKEYSAVEVISSTEVTKGHPLITIKA
ncbi:glucose PTS transporter subunit IIA [Ligilactobacillus murinus]|uniref:PTS system sucrose-specific EIIBCA component n=1 Tax=Ligilactobacillus murinus TaxID=1622 RepID=A0AAE7BPR9_9LACO|nr:glucose PTS transporter subunit IIA [Ligilactobacillus murinus]NEF83162.1 PTS beta-glucoside transporter subunit EIIBCA [Ligilactobacillus murinus]NEF84962.1 PTS beta-glucoside transporter subunit EIIBCA [Ligilactobacillus murinus]NEF87715.1 PTS beta-glucoside transporter subunit EIIBCA [Ligilactobacillus murinus]NEF90011.1 PTS beta-glucoside transporter subunit EIIBCA [Ligilactobacillus murinus]NEF92287.1 PTS beta-glucoside transporter subunit EIIBCA [Ligilactobacillus murinus]